MLSKAELGYLKTQRLAMVATANSKGVPEVSPVWFQFDVGRFWVGSRSQDIFFKTRRHRNIAGGSGRIALAVDDLLYVDPWRPRGVKVSGVAEVMDHVGMFGPGKHSRVSPTLTASWG